MDEEVWSTVNFNVLLKCDFFGLVFVARANSSVKNSESDSHSVVDEEFHNWPKDIVDHSIDHRVANIVEP